jgi:hypothetical protein
MHCQLKTKEICYDERESHGQGNGVKEFATHTTCFMVHFDVACSGFSLKASEPVNKSAARAALISVYFSLTTSTRSMTLSWLSRESWRLICVSS